MKSQPIAYLLKMFPRFSETFVLSEILELERQGLRLHIVSLKRPNDGITHADVNRVRAPITYVPESFLRGFRAYASAHYEVFGWDRARYVRCLCSAARRALTRRGPFKHFMRAGFIASVLARDGINHVHAHFASSATSVALQLHELTGVSYSFTAHAKDIYRHSVETGSLARKLRSARFAVTVSDYNRRYLSSIDGTKPLVRIYNGIDVQRFVPNGVVRDDPPLILAVGRLVEKKGFADLIRACSLLREQGCAFKCRIVGKGELERDLLALTAALDLEDFVELAGPIPRERLITLYQRASVVVAPCVIGADGNRDGLPTVIVEAMALGVPVIATDVTGIPEIVENGRTGVLVHQHDPEEMAAAIRKVLGEPALAESLVGAGRARVANDFDLRANVAGLRTLLEDAQV